MLVLYSSYIVIVQRIVFIFGREKVNDGNYISVYICVYIYIYIYIYFFNFTYNIYFTNERY